METWPDDFDQVKIKPTEKIYEISFRDDHKRVFCVNNIAIQNGLLPLYDKPTAVTPQSQVVKAQPSRAT